ncbi:ankyrin repeat domain-containing protein [Aspergillus homomorphus CBS 101889]|uniref:Putative ankyrin repeat protein n=1 Tax=Aspergillus homomorphus (strain CBS 101889) TaxID=1450537 RepID=A0A395HXW1_ASPHC|nr:putative ankyrin repeat protein [Aspergillus homomorphus CBS 101889]RAL12762.1 putative ankyrin repeat protein [Aspergillus homomorphus CBS 101889]
MATTVTLPAETIDDLIYDARSGDLAALQEDLAACSAQFANASQGSIVAAVIDAAPEAEGGSGSSLLHFPAANGNFEILNYLLGLLAAEDEVTRRRIVNHRNHSGNTPLHWAALNTHLECVKALVEAGADSSIKNEAGLDPVFLAERADWSAQEEDGAASSASAEGAGEQDADAAAAADPGKMSKGRQVVEWMLSAEVAAAGGDSETVVASAGVPVTGNGDGETN